MMFYATMTTRRAFLGLLLMMLFTTTHGRDTLANNAYHAAEEDVTNAYNKTVALVLVKFASAVYTDDAHSLLSWSCPRCIGLTKGFQIADLVVDKRHCLQAFVGIAENLPAIVVAFRGTQERSYHNWIEDLYWKQLDFNYPGVTDAMVHHGFYSAYHNTTLRPRLIAAIQSLIYERPELPIMITGHSMGGAMGSFCALDLAANHDIENVEVVTFGQPRIGNPIFAIYYNDYVPKTIRMTHDHDIVPHLPPYYSVLHNWTYHHFAREVWIYSIPFGILNYEAQRLCDDTGEDSTCSRSVIGDSISDHLEYLGTSLRTDHSQDHQSGLSILGGTSSAPLNRLR